MTLLAFRTAIYARVWRAGRDPAMQRRELRAYAAHRGCCRSRRVHRPREWYRRRSAGLSRTPPLPGRKPCALLDSSSTVDAAGGSSAWRRGAARSTKQLIDALEGNSATSGWTLFSITEQIDFSPRHRQRHVHRVSTDRRVRSGRSFQAHCARASLSAGRHCAHGRPKLDELIIREIQRLGAPATCRIAEQLGITIRRRGGCREPGQAAMSRPRRRARGIRQQLAIARESFMRR